MHVARDEIVEQLRAALLEHPVVLEAYLFGSAARGEAGPESDIDIAVYLDPGVEEPPMGHAAVLTTALMAALHQDNIDLVTLNTAPPLLYHRVLRDGIRLVARDVRATITREGRALSRYCDYLPHLRKIDSVHAARIEAGDFGR